MITQRHVLRKDNSSVYFDLYLLDNSAEFQTNQRRPMVIVCPGGGYLFTSDREAEPIALRFLAHGFQAVVLRYAVQTAFPQPMLDLAQTILTLRQHADEWLINPDQIAVCGFSAGGHLAAASGVFWSHPFFYEPLGIHGEQIRPNALILGYPVIDLTLVSKAPFQADTGGQPEDIGDLMRKKIFGEAQPPQTVLERYRLDRHVTPSTPPTFLWHTADDELVPAKNSLLFAAALGEQGVPYELHIFDKGVHGLALADEVTEANDRFINPHCQIWIDLAVKWLKRQI